METIKGTRYHCKQLHGIQEEKWDNGMYHYSDEVIYSKHLKEDSVIEEVEREIEN